MCFSDKEIEDKEEAKESLKTLKRTHKSKSPDKRAMRKILQSSSSDELDQNSGTHKRSDKLPELNIKKMFTQSSNRSMRYENSENTSQIQGMNPNEADFPRQEVRRKVTRERSDIVKRLSADLDNVVNHSPSTFIRNNHIAKSASRRENEMEESAFSSSCEDIELDDSSSSPTGSEDLLDPKFLTPRNNITHNPPKPQIEEPKDFIYKRPKAYGLLCLPNGNILEYEIPK